MNLLLPKLKAAGIHFLISAVAVAIVVLGSLYFWYPGLQAYAAGLVTLVSILIVVDVVLGPALTLVVFKPGKKSLKFDLCSIAAVQIAALVFGVMSIYQARPVYFAFVVDRFETVAAADLEDSILREAMAQYQQLSNNGPRWVGVELPTDPRELDRLTIAEAIHGTGPALIPKYYQPLEQVIKNGMAKAKSIDTLNDFNPQELVDSKLFPYQENLGDLVFFPLAGRDRDLTVLVERESGSVVDVVDLRPWKA